MAKKMVMVGSALCMEALAVVEGLIFCKEVGFPRVLVESDSAEVVSSFAKGLSFLASIDVILQDGLAVARDVGVVDFVHVRRTGNICAHAVSQYACGVSVQEVWFDDPPPFLAPFILSDKGSPIVS
uniref:RNase H type-1 domain-containing protein n=1 Tax=Davidia involucrata TaxID=16924 RepID=A0A5B7AVY6_DAVIN